MQSLFNMQDNNSIQERINKLTPETKPLWGKMNVSQMMAHLQPTMLLSFGELKLKKSILAFFFGKTARKKIVNETPFTVGLPTLKAFKITPKDFETAKNELLNSVNRCKVEGAGIMTKKPHPFFGSLSTREWDMLQWKHLDHHLRQFGV